MGTHVFNPAIRRQKQEDYSEFKPSWFYIETLRLAKATKLTLSQNKRTKKNHCVMFKE